MSGNLRSIDNVTVRMAIVHVLDREHDEPILNDFLLDLTDEVEEFLRSHLMRGIRNEDAKAASFDEGRNLVRETCEAIIDAPEDEGGFMANTKDLARHLFRSMASGPDIPSCDLVVCTFESDGLIYVGILKLDYTRTYIHNMEFEDGRFKITIIPQLVGLPGLGQRAAHAAFVGRPDAKPQLLLVSRQAKADTPGSAAFFAGTFLQSRPYVDATEKTKKLKVAAEEWTRKSLKDDAVKAEGVRSEVMRSLRQGDPVDVNSIAKKAFREEPELRESFVAHMEENDVGGTVEVDPRWVEKSTRRVRIKTNNGIDVALPADLYEDKDQFQIMKNADGTLDILIRGIKRYKQS